MTQVCTTCKCCKYLSQFHWRRDSEKYRTQCKDCWKYIQASRRYSITFEQAVNYYKQPSCMCCGKVFSTMKERHLHHVDHSVRGIVCKECNILLGQETGEDLHRLKSCLVFMRAPRENLFDRVNQQGRLDQEDQSVPSTTERRTPLRTCKCCGRQLSLKHFYTQKYVSGKLGYHAACKKCFKILVKTYKYNLTFKQVAFLRSKKHCDCCGKTMDISYIHHVGESVLGAVCRLCNLCLEQETIQTQKRLLACVNWLTGDDTVWSA